MTALRRLPASFSILGSFAVVLLAGGAHAATCTADSDCPKTFTCQVTGASGGCAEPACAPGQTCPPVDCTTTEYKECVPGPCAVDSDCADGMVCYSQSVQDCPVYNEPACPPNAACPAIDPAPCTSKTVTACIPKYDLPCTTDASCGDGFTCVPDQECGCSGSSGGGAAADAGAPLPSSGSGNGTAGSSGSGTPAPAPEPYPPAGTGGSSSVTPPSPCSCTNLATKHCEAKQMNCAANTDCPTNWLCKADPNGVTTVCAGPAGTGGATPVCDPAPPPQLVCVPPYSDLGISRNSQGGLDTAGNTFGNSGSAGSTGAGAPTGSAGQTGAVSPTASGTGGSAASDTPAKSSDGGCQVGLGHTTSGSASFLGLLGLLGLARRRRPRAA